MKDKSLKIKQTMAANRARRAAMDLKVCSVKIDESHLNRDVRKNLEMAFVQAEWLYNDMLGKEDFFNREYKDKKVVVKKFNPLTQKCDIEEERNLTLGSQVLQSLIERGQQNIINLSKAKKSGLNIGGLKFVKEVNSIPLKQFGSTHKILDKNHTRIQGIGKIKVSGLYQVFGKECASAVLFRNAAGYFIKIACYADKKKIVRNGCVGIDFGIKDNITLSTGEKFNWNFQETQHHKRLQKRLSKKVKGNKNHFKQKQKLQKSHLKICNKKDDAANQFVSKLKSYETVVLQDESLHSWYSGFFGSQIQHSIIGRIKTTLKRLETSIVIDRWLPTTKMSPVSGKNINIGLKDRFFVDGDFLEDRDVKSAKTILCFGLYKSNLTSKELRRLPVEKIITFFKKFYIFEDKLFPSNQEALPFMAG